ISGFRGIKRLSLSFDELTTLISENTWCKSSLLDALSIALPANGSLYEFELKYFHVDYSIYHHQSQHIQIIVCFKAQDKHEAND
ncbi:YjbD family protein, partial [Vibrio parahaemolyticus]|nr:YjbD family protein [Vibrio parahaemolyticus]